MPFALHFVFFLCLAITPATQASKTKLEIFVLIDPYPWPLRSPFSLTLEPHPWPQHLTRDLCFSNTDVPTRARTHTIRTGDNLTEREVTAPPKLILTNLDRKHDISSLTRLTNDLRIFYLAFWHIGLDGDHRIVILQYFHGYQKQSTLLGRYLTGMKIAHTF